MTFVPRRRLFVGFSRRDAFRLFMVGAAMIVALTAILSVDILPSGFGGQVGDIATRDIRAPRSLEYISDTETQQRRAEARAQVPPQYDYTADRGRASAEAQTAAFEDAMAPVDAAFSITLPEDARDAALADALPNLSDGSLSTLQGLGPARWTALRSEMARVLESVQRAEVRDTAVGDIRAQLPDRIAARFDETERTLAAEILRPLIVANSSYDPVATETAKQAAETSVLPVRYSISKNEVIITEGQRIDEVRYDQLARLGMLEPTPDFTQATGWGLASALLVGLLLGWIWRFRPEVWHRPNSLFLVGLAIVLPTLALQLTAERSVLPYFIPTAAIGLLLAILLDAGIAVVAMAILGVLAGAVQGTAELGAYVFLGGLAGIVVIRRGERLTNFVQAAVAMAVVNVAVVTAFTLIGERDLTGVIQLWGAALAAAGGAAVAAVGSFAVLGSLFGITTSFQLLELANPSQPLLRRLLLETPGTYHHSLMVGNLGERAAEAIGADPLITRAAAYYHDIGKLANPGGFIENQGGGHNPHDELSPEESAQVVKAHVANGIDLGYRYRLPKPIISFIPQHHGTALMGFFHAKARERAVEEAGAVPGTAAARAAEATVDPARFRHAGPKPQSREAAILMLADSVEASVRSLTSQDEPAIRAMVARIIRERLEDGQFDECDLTLRDLDRIREAFIVQLLGMYHRRIAYPQNKIVELESRRAAGGRAG